jgi:hypothetical protein
MFKSRTITISLRLYAALGLAALLAAYIAGVTSHHETIIDQDIGPLDLGWKGGVGNHLAYSVLVGVALVAAFLATLLTAFRDADASAAAEVAQVEVVPLTQAPEGANYWPVVAALSLATVLLGLAVSNRALALAAGVVLAATAVMWTIRAWSERATGDDRANLEVYRQVVEPIRLPFGALLIVGVVILGFSRVLLTLPSKHASTAVFGLLGVVILGGCVAIALRPKISRAVIMVVVVLFGVAVITGGIVGAARGPRHFESHERTSSSQVPLNSGR